MKRIPVTILTGFLGSGKTTLLNRILTQNHGEQIAVIENEFGEIGIDHSLIVNADEEIVEMSNGCICCTVRGDLIKALGNLLTRTQRLDRVVVETTGLADPGPVAQTFLIDPEIRARFVLDGITTLVDARHIAHHLSDSREAQEQIAFADVLVLNKIDLVSEEQLAYLERRLRPMNAMARMVRAEMASVPLQLVLDIGGFDLGRALEHKPSFLQPEYPFEWAGLFDLPDGTANLTLAPGPDPSMSLLFVPCSEPQAWESMAERVFGLFSSEATPRRHGDELLSGDRVHRLDLAGAAAHFSLRAPRPGRYALFTQHLPEEFALQLSSANGERLLPTTETRFAAQHTHDASVSSVGIETGGVVEEARFQPWLTRLVREQGQDIFRMKGVLNLDDEARRFVLQGVHMLFEGRPGTAWGSAARINRMVFIGRNLDRARLEQEFQACLR